MNRKHAACAVALAALAAGALSPARAASSQAWVLRNRNDFVKADLSGVSLAPDGALRLSAHAIQLLDTAQPSVWCLARDAQGAIYAGSGNEGKVFKISPGGGKSEVVFDAAELQVQALAFDREGRLYAGTSPRGAVYRVGSDGHGEVVFDPEEVYIWAIVFDARGRMHVATGQRGRVYRVDNPGPKATGVVEVDGREDHVRSLVAGPGGTLYAGTDQSGIVYAIPPDGPATVLYDTPMREVSAITVINDSIYVAALAPISRPRGGGPAPQGAGVTRVMVTPDEPGPGEPPGGERGRDDQGEQSQPAPAPPRPQPTSESYYGAVYRIAASGYARRIWESRDALPLSLAPYPDREGAAQPGRVLVGTGNDGRILLLEDSGDATDYVEVGSAQVNALLVSQGAKGGAGLYAAASNLGQVAWIDAAGADSGTVTSEVLDAGFTSSWGMVSWNGEFPAGSSIVIAARTGNTEEPDTSWSGWSADYAQREGSLIERPRARYLQWRAALKGGRSGGPTLRSVQINYLQDNLPPEVSIIEVQPPGITLLGGGGVSDSPDAAGRRPAAQPRRGFDRGRRAASWKAEDVNADQIRYELFFKAEDETLWKSLAKDLTEPFYTWDATALPDGVYRLKVTATDAPSNPEGAALTGSEISEAFDIDNTPPLVDTPQARLSGRTAEVSVNVSDSFSVVGETAWSLDAGDWIVLLPVDRIADSRKESYRFKTPDLQPGEHTITVRAQDRAGNVAASKVVIEVK